MKYIPSIKGEIGSLFFILFLDAEIAPFLRSQDLAFFTFIGNFPLASGWFSPSVFGGI